MKILTVIGARPQFVKAAALSREFKKHSQITELLVHTGQHFDKNMSEVFFEEMEIPKPKYNLDVNGLGHGAMTGRMLEGIEELIQSETPDLLLVYGDTNSTIAGALAAKKLHVKVGHVEAGLRSFNMKMPEEVNRILTDRISDLLFCPTDTAIKNLKNEGYDNIDTNIYKCGDVMQDAAYFYAAKSEEKATVLKGLGLDQFALCTIHRPENTDNLDRLKNIIVALNEVNKTLPVVLPLHPRTRNILKDQNIDFEGELIEPVGYFDMIELLKNCSVVVTDSGGLQKEAYFFKKNCVTMRDQTEWVELIEHDVNVIVGADPERIIAEIARMKNQQSNFDVDLYGKGSACPNIAKDIIEYFNA